MGGTREWADRQWRSDRMILHQVRYTDSTDSEYRGGFFCAMKSAPAQIQSPRSPLRPNSISFGNQPTIITPSGNIVEKVKLVEQQELSDVERLQILTQSKLLKQLDED